MLFHLYIAYQPHPEPCPERSEWSSEKSGTIGSVMLRYAQHDKAELILSGLYRTATQCAPNNNQACSQCCERSTARFQSA